MKQAMLFIIILLLASNCYAQEADSISCFADSEVSIKVVLPRVFGEKEFVQSLNTLINEKYKSWIKLITDNKTISNEQSELLRNIKISVSESKNTIGSCQGNNIIIDEGNLLVAYNMSYALSLLINEKVDLETFNLWHDYLIDSIILSDPIVYVKGTDDFQKFIFSHGGLDKNVEKIFLAIFHSWIGFFIFHEVSHIMLKHSLRWRQKYPNLNYQDKRQWTEDHFKFSQELELEADKKAIQLFMGGTKYDLGSSFSAFADWFMVRNMAIKKSGFRIYPTHPNPINRMDNFIKVYCEIKKCDSEDISKFISNYINSYEKKINEGILIEVPTLRGQRPKEISANDERYLLRDMQLKIYAEKRK